MLKSADEFLNLNLPRSLLSSVIIPFWSCIEVDVRAVCNIKMSIKNTEIKSKTKPQPVIRQYYLIGYNAAQTIGWLILLWQLISYYLLSGSQSLYDTVKYTVIVFQNAAVLEVVHAATGIVKSNPIITAFQVASRVIVVVGVLMATVSARESVGLPLALLAWSITEIIRYSTYTLTLLNSVPYILKWLRYSTFIILYPIGVTGELLCLYSAQKEVGENSLYSYSMPNTLNFIFNYKYLLVIVMLLYIPLFPQLYMHMFSQRRKVVGGDTSKKQN